MPHVRPTLAVLLVMASLLAHATALAGSHHIDQFWQSPELPQRHVRTVVIVPAATWNDDHEASVMPPDAWIEAFANSGFRWVTAGEVTERFGARPRTRDSLFASIAGQQRDKGIVDARTAGFLTRAFHAQAVLCLRVDHWEAKLGAGSRNTASIELRCSLVDSAGVELWRIAGRSLHDGGLVSGPNVERGRNEGSTEPAPSGWTGAIPATGIAGMPGAATTTVSSGVAGGMRSLPQSPSGSGGGSTRAASSVTNATNDTEGVSSIYRGALMRLFGDWAPRLPGPTPEQP